MADPVCVSVPLSNDYVAELQCMAALDYLITMPQFSLTEPARYRVMHWLAEKHTPGLLK